MSRILVVQPCRMLQQAFAFALASEHQIEVTDKVSESGAAPEADLVIVDPVALDDEGAAMTRELNAIFSWRIPVVWLGDAPPAVDTGPSKFVRLAPPLDRESLKKALADVCGTSTQGGKLSSTPKPDPITAAASKPSKAKVMKPGSIAGENKKKVIELVEVVEEGPTHDMIKTGAGNKS